MQDSNVSIEAFERRMEHLLGRSLVDVEADRFRALGSLGLDVFEMTMVVRECKAISPRFEIPMSIAAAGELCLALIIHESEVG